MRSKLKPDDTVQNLTSILRQLVTRFSFAVLISSVRIVMYTISLVL